MALLEIHELHMRLEGQPVLQDIELTLEPGEVLGLLGANGSGKSTLLRCIAGLLDARSGGVWIGGRCVAADPLFARQRLGYSVDPATLPARLTGQQCLELFAAARGLAKLPAATLSLAEDLRLSSMLYAEVGRYSLGTRQKLAFCLALLGEPPLLLLDEVFNGLDLLAVHTAKQAIHHLAATRGCAVMLATHLLDSTQEIMTRIALLDAGRLHAQWDQPALQSLRDQGRSLEHVLVEQMLALREDPLRVL